MPEQTPQDELDGAHIKRHADLRRSTNRSRSHAVIIAFASVVLVLQIIWTIVQHGRERAMSWLDGLYAACIVGLVWVAIECVRRARFLAQELNNNPLPEPDAPPDFSTLSDGSQFARNLQEVRDDTEQDSF